MENATAAVANFPPRQPRPWLLHEIESTVLTAVAFYIFASFAFYEARSVSARSRVPKVTQDNRLSTRVEDFMARGSLCLVASFSALLRCALQQVELRWGRQSDPACRFYQIEIAALFHLSMLSLYLLLWTRQLKMYRHKHLRHLASACQRCFSIGVLAGIFCSSIATPVSYICIFTLISSPQGCVYDLSSLSNDLSTSLPGTLLLVAAAVFQFSLLGLLAYPLSKRYKLCCCASDHSASHLHNSSEAAVRRTVLRLSVSATVCVCCDFASTCILSFTHDGVSPIFFYADIYSINLIAINVAVVCSFADWHARLLPWCFGAAIDVDGAADATTSDSGARHQSSLLPSNDANRVRVEYEVSNSTSMIK